MSERTIGDHFRAGGYATAYVGKWHSGLYLDDYLPDRRGFDRFVSFANGAQDQTKRAVSENANTLCFNTAEWE